MRMGITGANGAEAILTASAANRAPTRIGCQSLPSFGSLNCPALLELVPLYGEIISSFQRLTERH